jgi:hypothetical protein
VRWRCNMLCGVLHDSMCHIVWGSRGWGRTAAWITCYLLEVPLGCRRAGNMCYEPQIPCPLDIYMTCAANARPLFVS